MPRRSWNVYVRPPLVGSGQRRCEVGNQRAAVQATHALEPDETVAGDREHRPGRGRVADSLVERVGGDRRRTDAGCRHGGRRRSRARSARRGRPIDARLCGPLPTAIVWTMSLRRRVDADDPAAVAVGNPDRALAREHRRRARPDRDHGRDGVAGRIDTRDGSVEAVRDPDRAVPDRDRLGPVADVELLESAGAQDRGA